MSVKTRGDARHQRHLRVRKKVYGKLARPRLCVFRSNNHIYAQIIDDTKGHTIVQAGTVEPDIKAKLEGPGGNIVAAKMVGTAVAERALKLGIGTVVFDRAGYLYHGRVAALATAAREAGLVF